ncbi:succinyl-diaminopimelate desuccinylase [Secundilactobacillus odoratitofui DSM 19909 = JCM 15043]|uniref:Succinyl-diaminopimelate desuccinylase n=1 Tax=Secundilactobacillus odoratitofui DSM 19909 = JCM 15043 TaxID=1423776 RepID=A0A0R1LNQ0_9LACO|nr:ArgE/DapE family deacylase [Secundilactobacillus odoratitofui]KRK97453.1 succinyl-diaminopimelate desuccinylase [Secundilactobacillus odoratitofui DSM 19909 = JCM 15043]
MDKQTKIDILTHLVQIDSANDHEQRVADYLQQLLSDHGITAKQIETATGRTNLVAEIGDSKSTKVFALAGHLDTVSFGNLSDWAHDPLSAEIHGDRLYGRGSADMKGSVAAMIITLVELKESGQSLPGRIRFIGTVGEEYGAMGSRQLTEQGVIDDVDGMIIGEPTSGDVVYAHNGSLNYTVSSEGKPIHSSMPENGVNALTNMVKFINAEADLFNDVKPSKEVGPLVHSITVFNSGDQVNTIPGHATLQGNIRATPEFGNGAVIKRLNMIVRGLSSAPGVDLSFNVDHAFDPVVTDAEDPLVTLAQSVSSSVLKRDVDLKVIHGATDASEYRKAEHQFPIVVLGAGDWENAHKMNEYVELSQFLVMSDIYQKIALDYLRK